VPVLKEQCGYDDEVEPFTYRATVSPLETPAVTKKFFAVHLYAIGISIAVILPLQFAFVTEVAGTKTYVPGVLPTPPRQKVSTNTALAL
jgi:hypothetical protein